jgi:hypothetical protein
MPTVPRVAVRRFFCRRYRQRLRYVQLKRRGACLCEHVSVIAKHDTTFVAVDAELTPKRNGAPKAHPNRALQEPGQQAGDVAPVSDPLKTAITLVDNNVPGHDPRAYSSARPTSECFARTDPEASAG